MFFYMSISIARKYSIYILTYKTWNVKTLTHAHDVYNLLKIQEYPYITELHHQVYGKD